MLPYQIIDSGSFVCPSTLSQQVQFTDQPTFFFLKNRTSWGDATAVLAVESQWDRGMAQGAALAKDQAVTTNILSSSAVTSAGFTFIDQANPPVYAALATTNISGNTGAFVATMADTGNISAGDWVRVYATTGELQIAGYTFQVTSVSANTSVTFGYMATAVSSGGLANFAAAATAGYVKKFIPNKFYPRHAYVAMITKATQGVVYFTGKNDYTPGELIRFQVPSAFGMNEIDRVQARVLSVTNSSTESSIVIDLDTSGFTTFSFPTSAVAAAGVSPAMVAPSASGVIPDNGSATIPQIPESTNDRDAFDNRFQFVMDMGANVLTVSGDTYDWWAVKADRYNGS